ncbi:MAG: hypothetical protein V1723_04475 [Candidatus Uhrbacteria bacterium]
MSGEASFCHRIRDAIASASTRQRDALIVWLLVVLVFVFSGCVSARYSTVPAPQLTADCGQFEAESYTRGVAVSEAVQGYGTACRDAQMARADAAYVASLRATANWFVQNDGGDPIARAGVVEVSGQLRDLTAVTLSHLTADPLPALATPAAAGGTP